MFSSSRRIKQIVLSLASILPTALASLAMVAAAAPVVSTESGRVRGIDASGIHEFLGIPYAEPPLGALRWTPPGPHKHWSGTLQATQFGSECSQPGPIGPIGSEDCLFLNVYTPNFKRNHRESFDEEGGEDGAPVMVWIHGGALVTGGGDLYDPTELVKKGVIVVTINYRLGLLGFFAHPALDAEGHLNANYGYMDQQRALKWVHKNIEEFGGDPHKVTIFGESAGGQSVYSNIASPTATGLFQRAIAESGAYSSFQDYLESIVPLAAAETIGTNLVPAGTTLATKVGCASQTAQCLRAVPAATLIGAEPGTLYPFVDGTLLPQNPGDAFSSGKFNRVPVISGTNHDEWRFFVAFQYDFGVGPLTDAQYPAAVLALWGPVLAPLLITTFYPLVNYPPPPGVMSAPLALGASGTDGIFSCPARNADRSLSKYVPTYAYEFNDENAPAFGGVSFPLGAYHFAEVQYLFVVGGTPAPFTPDQEELSDAMIGYWTQFAKTANPNFDGAPMWPIYTSATDLFESLIPPIPAPEFNFDAEHKCSIFWNTF